MPKMMNRTLKPGTCCCWDCDGPISKGRSQEKREWQVEARAEALHLVQDHDEEEEWV